MEAGTKERWAAELLCAVEFLGEERGPGFSDAERLMGKGGAFKVEDG